jgi:hypothetical protein
MKFWNMAVAFTACGGTAIMRTNRFAVVLALTLTILVGGCGSGPSSFVRSDADFSFVQRGAIMPFKNLSQDLHAGERMRSVFMSAVLDRDALPLVDLGETMAAMNRMRMNPEAVLTREQIVALGQELEVDALFMGTVEEYGPERMSNDRVYVVTASFTMVETQTGSVVWQAQVHEDGTSFWRKLFGGGSASLYAVSHTAVDKALETLF